MSLSFPSVIKGGESVLFAPQGKVHRPLLSGENPTEPIAVYGPLIMNTRLELAETFKRYRACKAGCLGPIHVSI